MKMNNYKLISILLFLLVCVIHDNLHAQNLAEVEGTTEIKMNSTTGVPHINLIEDDTSTGGSTRIKMEHVLNNSDYFELRSFLASGNQRIGWYFNGSPKMVYSEFYNGLGIGTASPEAGIHVLGGGLFEFDSNGTTPTLELKETQTDDYSRLFFTNTNSSNRWSLAGRVGTENLFGLFYDGSARIIYNEDNEGLGIGTSNPSQLVHLNFSGTNGIRVQGDGTGDVRGMYITNGGGAHFVFDDNSDENNLKIQSANELAFLTGGVNERMRISALNGEVGINDGLNVNRRLGVQTENDLYGIYSDQNGTGTAYGIFASTESNGAQTKYGINASISGTAGTGNSYALRGFASTTPDNFWAIYAAGDLWYTGTLKAPSDERLKKNIEDLDPVLDRVMQLETKTYEFDRETYAGLNLAKGTQVGFIAQNVQNLFPTLVEEERHVYETNVNQETGQVTEVEVNILGMSSVEMIPILTKALQEQQLLIEELRKDLEEIRAEK